MQTDSYLQSLVPRVALLARKNAKLADLEHQGRADGYRDSERILRGSRKRTVAEVITQHQHEAGEAEAEAQTLTKSPEKYRHVGRKHAYLQVVEMIREGIE